MDFTISELAEHEKTFKSKILGSKITTWQQVCGETTHRIIPLDYIDGSIKEGLKNRLKQKPDIPIYPMGYYEVPKGRIIGNGAVVDADDQLLFSKKLTFDKVGPGKVKAFRCGELIDEKTVRLADDKVIKKVPQAVINIMMPGMYIYGHWLIDLLPKLYLLQQQLNFSKCKIALPHDIPSYALDFLKMIGLDESMVLYFDPANEILECKVVILPTKCRIIDGSWLAPYVGTMYDEIASRIGVTDNNLPKRLYLSRRRLKKQFRKLVNREEVSEMILSYGFTEIFPEDYSLEEQLKLYKNAELMVGEFGSALHNSLFSSKDLKVISLQSSHIPLLVQWGICNIKGQSCSLIFGETTEIRRSINSDFLIDLEMLDQALSNYCK